MNRRAKKFTALLFLLGIALIFGNDTGVQKKGTDMQEKTELVLPYKLELVDLPKVEITCEITSPKGGYGTESIRISGLSGVTLSHRDAKGGHPVELHGKLDPDAFTTLLKLFEESGFMEMDEDHIGNPEGPKRTLGLTLPGRKKKVEITGMEVDEDSRLIGAIKLAAGLSVPEALQKKFLSHL